MNELAFLDASVAVGYLAGMPPEQATRATEITEGDSRLTVTAVCLVEVYFALATRYQFSGYRIVDYLTALVLKDNVSVHAIDEDLLVQGLEMCRGSTRVSTGDALVRASARTARATAIYPFDQRFPDEGMDVRE